MENFATSNGIVQVSDGVLKPCNTFLRFVMQEKALICHEKFNFLLQQNLIKFLEVWCGYTDGNLEWKSLIDVTRFVHSQFFSVCNSLKEDLDVLWDAIYWIFKEDFTNFLVNSCPVLRLGVELISPSIPIALNRILPPQKNLFPITFS